jgi:hypothetical protein
MIYTKPIKTICRELRVSRKVVRKVIRSPATEFRYERGRQPLPRIDPWRDQFDALLLANEEKPARERLTLIRIIEELRGLGYEGSYDADRAWMRGDRRYRRESQRSSDALWVVRRSTAPARARPSTPRIPRGSRTGLRIESLGALNCNQRLVVES